MPDCCRACTRLAHDLLLWPQITECSRFSLQYYQHHWKLNQSNTRYLSLINNKIITITLFKNFIRHAVNACSMRLRWSYPHMLCWVYRDGQEAACFALDIGNTLTCMRFHLILDLGWEYETGVGYNKSLYRLIQRLWHRRGSSVPWRATWTLCILYKHVRLRNKNYF